jgi:hypothetical protein
MPIQDRDWYRSEPSRMTRIQAMMHRERKEALQRQARHKLPNAADVVIQPRKLDALNWRGRKLVFNGVIASWALALVVAFVWLLMR